MKRAELHGYCFKGPRRLIINISRKWIESCESVPCEKKERRKIWYRYRDAGNMLNSSPREINENWRATWSVAFNAYQRGWYPEERTWQNLRAEWRLGRICSDGLGTAVRTEVTVYWETISFHSKHLHRRPWWIGAPFNDFKSRSTRVRGFFYFSGYTTFTFTPNTNCFDPRNHDYYSALTKFECSKILWRTLWWPIWKRRL